MFVANCQVFPNGSDRGFALAGPIVKDLSGNLLVLTARALLAGAEMLDLRSVGQTVGSGVRPTLYAHNQGDPTSPVKLVGWFSPTSPIEESLLTGLASPADARAVALGDDVVLHGAGGLAAGRICGLDCYATFDLPNDGEPRRIEGLLRAESPVVGQPLVKKGDAGALVLAGGQPLGLVVGILDGAALIAPLDEVLSAEGLVMATVADIASFNTWRRAERPLDEAHVVAAALQAIVGPAQDEKAITNAFCQWVLKGWKSIRRGEPSPFAPYDAHFVGVQNDVNAMRDALLDFGSATIPGFDTGIGFDVLDTAFGLLVEQEVDTSTGQRSSVGKTQAFGSHAFVVRAVEKRAYADAS